jgi:hypothetical protein
MLIKTSVHNPWDTSRPTDWLAPESAPSRANDTQVAGDHYKQFKYETWDVILDWGLGYLDGNAVKYLSRWRHKNGIEDLKKARHYIDKLIETETEKLERARATDHP